MGRLDRTELYLQHISVDDELPDSYLSHLPVIKRLIKADGLEFTAPVTMLVGENGAGKSTLIEAFSRGSRKDAPLPVREEKLKLFLQALPRFFQLFGTFAVAPIAGAYVPKERMGVEQCGGFALCDQLLAHLFQVPQKLLVVVP